MVRKECKLEFLSNSNVILLRHPTECGHVLCKTQFSYWTTMRTMLEPMKDISFLLHYEVRVIMDMIKVSEQYKELKELMWTGASAIQRKRSRDKREVAHEAKENLSVLFPSLWESALENHGIWLRGSVFWMYAMFTFETLLILQLAILKNSKGMCGFMFIIRVWFNERGIAGRKKIQMLKMMNAGYAWIIGWFCQ